VCIAALRAASILRRNGSYTAAVDTLRRALGMAAERSDVERCLLQWSGTLDYAAYITPSLDPASVQPEQARALYRDTLQAMRASTRPAWLRATATEFLAADRLRAHDDAAALALYTELAALEGADTLLAQRAHKALVFLHHRRLRDYRTAYSVYERIEERFPGTDAVIFAKIDLGLPLTEEDRQAMTRLPKQDPEPGAAIAGDDGFLLDPVYPNPARTAAVVGYELRGDATVTVTVYDARGRMASMPATRLVQGAGRHACAIDVSLLSAGVYRCRVAVRDGGTGIMTVREQSMVVVP
jgi:hypothetical protein